MRLIYNEALNKRILPYLEKLTKKKSSLDKETRTLFDIFMIWIPGMAHIATSWSLAL